MTELNYLRVPRALDGLEPLALDMTEIRAAERRLNEVAFTNSLRAPELLALFNGAYLITSRYLNLLEYELDLAERRYAEIRAIFLLDKLPELLAAKGLATSRSPLGSEDVRQAFLDRDPDCRKVQELISTIRCYIGLLETQQKGFENAYNSVKKLIGSDGRDFRQNPNLVQPLVPTNGLAERPPQDFTPKLTSSSAVDDDFFGNPKEGHDMANPKNKKFMEKLMKLEGAVREAQNPHTTVIASPSPSLNFTFGNGHGLPRGYSMLLYGPPRGGKSVICNAMAGQMHHDYPDSWVVKFNTEFREGGQTDASQKLLYGIDPERYLAFEVNQPDMIFDRIEKELAALVQDGMDLGLVIIDSLNGVQGRRAMNADSIMTQQIGDNALTIQEGLKRILPVQRKCNFGLILTSHIRAQMDTKVSGGAVVHTSQSTAIRPAVSYGTQHHCEYYMYVAPAGGADGKKDLLGNEFKDTTVEDLQGNAERTGHKIRVKITDNSVGPKGRVGEFTFDYSKGFINVHEEVFLLGVGRGIIDRPNNLMYSFDGHEWKGKEAMLSAIRDDQQLAQKILQELKRRDMAGFYKAEPEGGNS